MNELFTNNEIIRNLFIGAFLIFIAILGVLSSFYLISLRLDSILYARTLNGIRKYFFSEKIDFEEQYRILPKQTNQPKYKDFHTFGILVYSVALINSIYFSLGTFIISRIGNDFFNNYLHLKPLISNYNLWWTLFCFILIFVLHISYYNFITNYRTSAYMRSSIIGIDIDGVLNKHRDTFCEKYMDNLKNEYQDDIIPDNKKLKPADIIKIPVNQIEGINISNNDEFDVFNSPNYWIEQMPISEDVGKIVQKLKNTYGYKIRIHSYRPWPQFTYGTIDQDLVKSNWKAKSLKKITKEWLRTHSIPYNSIYIEDTSIDYSAQSYSLFGMLFGIPKSQFQNRFFYTKNKPYRYFVEDTPENAIKLSSNCDYVFLIEQPYNIEPNYSEKLPINVIRVKNWNEIENIIKKLG